MSVAPKPPTKTRARFSYAMGKTFKYGFSGGEKEVIRGHYTYDDGSDHREFSRDYKYSTPLELQVILDVSDTGRTDVDRRAFAIDTQIKTACVTGKTQLDSMVYAVRLEGPGRFYTQTWEQELVEVVTGTRTQPQAYSVDQVENLVDNQIEKVTRFNPLQIPGRPAWNHWSGIQFKDHLNLEPDVEGLRLSITVECKFIQRTILFVRKKSTAIFQFDVELVKRDWGREKARQQAIAQGTRPAGPEPFALADSRWGPEAKWNISLEKKRVVRGTVWHNVKGVQGTALKSVGPGIFRWWQHDREDQARSAIVPKIYARGRTQGGSEARQQDPEQGDNGCDSVPLPLYEA